MKTIIQLSLAFLAVKYLMACAPVQFDHIVNADASAGAVSCTGSACIQSHTDTLTVGRGKSDILFVVDNSGSMSDVMTKIAARFADFFGLIQQQDYQIAITTTDVVAVPGSSTPPQGGSFIQFTDGSSVLTPSSSNPTAQFNSAITRPETAYCQQHGYQSSMCPSSQPRAIYAAILAMQKQGGFFRSGVPLTLVIVSDADERAGDTNLTGPTGNIRALYPLETNDLPNTLIGAIDPSKKLIVSDFIIQPGDTTCYDLRKNRNGNPFLFGFYGYIYSQLASATGGVPGSVCDSDYGSRFQSIAATINTVNSMGFKCTPYQGHYNVSFNPAAPGIVGTLNSSGDQLIFNQAVPTGTTITLQYDCGV
jgi:putative hemolysin